MPLSGVRAIYATENVIPDYCNIGVMFRALVAVNAVALITALLRSEGWQAGLQAFIDFSVLVEVASLTSMFALCGMRGFALDLPPVVQRLVCALVPAASTMPVVYFLSLIESPASGVPYSALVRGALAAAVAGAALQHYFELRTRAYSPVLAEARLQALQARIRPHFLFNSLNAVLSLIRSEPRQAENTLEDLADLFRVLLRDARDLTTLEHEIHLCRQYLAIEQIRLGERLIVQWDTSAISDDILRRAQIPALLLQPLLENAVHHGVEPSSEPAAIRIRIGRLLDRIEILITNPYHGTVDTQGNQMALENIRERLSLLYDVEAQLATTAEKGRFEVRLRFPYRKAA